MAFIANQSKIEPTVTQVLEDISSPTCEGEANLSAPPGEPRDRERAQ